MEGDVDSHSERRTADNVDGTISSVVDIIIVIIVYSPVGDPSVSWRQSLYSVSKEVRCR